MEVKVMLSLGLCMEVEKASTVMVGWLIIFQ